MSQKEMSKLFDKSIWIIRRLLIKLDANLLDYKIAKIQINLNKKPTTFYSLSMIEYIANQIGYNQFTNFKKSLIGNEKKFE